MKNEPIIEDIDSHEISSSDIEHYIPTNTDDKLEVDETVYSLLEYISLEWPSQTVINSLSNIYVATNPVELKDTANIIKFNFADTNNFSNFKDFTYDKKFINTNYNRMRIKDTNLICISDNSLDILKVDDCVKLESVDGKYGYGLDVSDNIVVGNKSGKITMFNDSLKVMNEYKYHNGSVESIVFYNNILYTGSCDYSLKGFDMRSEETVFEYKNKCDINAVDYCDNKLIAGCDDGIILLTDLRNNMTEKIKWHDSPISYIKWKNKYEFVSCSDEQVTIWDTSFEEEWEHHKYLRFVHQGQKLYKEICFIDDMYVVTSVDGLCFFKLAI